MINIDLKAQVKDWKEIRDLMNKYRNEPRWSLETNSMFYKLERMMRDYFNKYQIPFNLGDFER